MTHPLRWDVRRIGGETIARQATLQEALEAVRSDMAPWRRYTFRAIPRKRAEVETDLRVDGSGSVSILGGSGPHREGEAAMISKQQASALIDIIQVVDQAIEAAGPDGIPAGHLYAMVMPHRIDLDSFERIVGILVDCKRVSRSPSHLLRAIR